MAGVDGGRLLPRAPRAGLEALCDVADLHLPLLLVSDEVFHWVAARAGLGINFLDPFVRLLQEGISDGSMRRLGRAEEVADALFNTVCWSYVHLRGRHQWSRARARRLVLGLALEGATAR